MGAKSRKGQLQRLLRWAHGLSKGKWALSESMQLRHATILWLRERCQNAKARQLGTARASRA